MLAIVRASLSCTTNVRIGFLPPGSSVKYETSRSPNQVIAAERGIGVAVITKRCGVNSVHSASREVTLTLALREVTLTSRAFTLTLRISTFRCSTPKRCCSSITTNAKRVGLKLEENAACVATINAGSPLATLASARLRSASFMPPVTTTTGTSIFARRTICRKFSAC